jgi:hypothetical protein
MQQTNQRGKFHFPFFHFCCQCAQVVFDFGKLQLGRNLGAIIISNEQTLLLEQQCHFPD